MKILELTGWPAVILAIFLTALLCCVGFVLVESENLHAWLAKPLQEATIKDVVVPLLAFAMLARK